MLNAVKGLTVINHVRGAFPCLTLMMRCGAAGWCAGKNVFPSLMYAGMQLSVVGIGLPSLTGCMLLYSVLLVGVVHSF